jgi:hypothetical protein
MKEIVKFLDDLPFIVKVILALPGLDGFVWGIYRIAKGKLIEGIIWILVGWAILWIIDLFSLFTTGKISYFA